MKFDWRDIKLGFWLAAGMAVFTLLLGLISRLISKARG
jgi:hypothetical protein